VNSASESSERIGKRNNKRNREIIGKIISERNNQRMRREDAA